jgi:hypothetical protein
MLLLLTKIYERKTIFLEMFPNRVLHTRGFLRSRGQQQAQAQGKDAHSRNTQGIFNQSYQAQEVLHVPKNA